MNRRVRAACCCSMQQHIIYIYLVYIMSIPEVVPPINQYLYYCSTRQMLRISYFWPDWNSYARQDVFHTISSTKRSHSFVFFSKNLKTQIMNNQILKRMSRTVLYPPPPRLRPCMIMSTPPPL